MIPIRSKNSYARIKDNRNIISQDRRRPEHPGPYIYVGVWVANDDAGNDPPVTSWQSPPWQNGWTWLDTAYVGFRHGLDGLTEFTGTLDTSGATSGTTAFTLPAPFRPDNDFSFITDLDQGGGSFSAARVTVSTAGAVKIYFPLTP